MSKHDQAIIYRVRCSSAAQRDRLKIKAKEVARLMALENAEMLEVVLDHALPDFSLPMDRTPMERRMGAEYMSETDKKQSGTSQGRRTRAISGVRPSKTQED